MSKLENIISYLRENWTIAKKSTFDNEIFSFRLICKFYDAYYLNDIYDFFNQLNYKPDIEYIKLFTISNGCELFTDIDYRQAGLILYSIEELKIKNSYWKSSYRENEFLNGDLIIGEFLGDSDLVILRCDNSKDDCGKIIISLPIDNRNEWFFLNQTFEVFIENFTQFEGEKFWE